MCNNEQNKQKVANLKDENRVSRDLWWTAAGAVAKLRRDDQLPLLSFTHPNLGFMMSTVYKIKFWSYCCKTQLTSPWSQPLITLPVPNWKVSGWPLEISHISETKGLPLETSNIRENSTNCAEGSVTLGCCCQIRCHPHTECQCSAENHSYIPIFLYSCFFSQSEYLPCGGYPHFLFWSGNLQQGSFSSLRFAALSLASSLPKQETQTRETDRQTSFSGKMTLSIKFLASTYNNFQHLASRLNFNKGEKVMRERHVSGS